MVEQTSHMFITGPDVIYAVTKEEIDKETLGGAITHEAISGVCHLTAKSDAALIDVTKLLLSFIPQNNQDLTPIKETNDIPTRPSPILNGVVPQNPQLPYDIRVIINEVVDDKFFFEVQPLYASNIVIGFARIDGQSVGIVANQPQVLAGCIDINASDKAARFVRFCDAFNLPIISFVDVPGFLPGVEQEHGGIIRHGAKLLYAYSESTVPKITVITRKAYGGAYDVMASKHIGADFNFAYPNSEIAVMGASGAVQIIYRKELNGLSGKDLQNKTKELEDLYKEQFSNPWEAAKLGFIDAVIEPQYTREYLAKSLDFLKGKKASKPKRKHGNIPL
jgi:propionyl-CoA carboxylase beta chain